MLKIITEIFKHAKLLYVRKDNVMTGKYRALDIARYIIDYSNRQKYYVDNLKLQKLLYYVQAHFLCDLDDRVPCFKDEIKAWPFGPVVPEVYREFKRYGATLIPTVRCYYDWSMKEGYDHPEWCQVKYSDSFLNENDKHEINRVVDSYKGYSSVDMMHKAHSEDPWINARKKVDNIITSKEIQEYYGF